MSTAGPLPAAPGSGPDYHLEAYKLLADMYTQEDSIFWTRNQTFLVLNSGLVAILVGILGLQSKQSPAAPSPAPVTSQSVPAAPDAPPSPITIQQIVNQPAAPPTASAPVALWLPLFSICVLGVPLCFVWMILVMRAQGVNDHLVIHMKNL